jgi:hypothetical protein
MGGALVDVAEPVARLPSAASAVSAAIPATSKAKLELVMARSRLYALEAQEKDVLGSSAETDQALAPLQRFFLPVVSRSAPSQAATSAGQTGFRVFLLPLELMDSGRWRFPTLEQQFALSVVAATVPGACYGGVHVSTDPLVLDLLTETGWHVFRDRTPAAMASASVTLALPLGSGAADVDAAVTAATATDAATSASGRSTPTSSHAPSPIPAAAGSSAAAVAATDEALLGALAVHRQRLQRLEAMGQSLAQLPLGQRNATPMVQRVAALHSRGKCSPHLVFVTCVATSSCMCNFGWFL